MRCFLLPRIVLRFRICIVSETGSYLQIAECAVLHELWNELREMNAIAEISVPVETVARYLR